MRILMIAFFITLSGCAYQPCKSIDVAFKAGHWEHKSSAPGDAPGIFEAECELVANVFTERDSISVGFFHYSDILRGAPFNSEADPKLDMWTLGYNINLYSR